MAKDLARRQCREGTVVISEEQTSGRGRLDRTWNSPAGNNLYMSVITYPRMEPSMLHLINLAAGLAVVSSIRKVSNLSCSLKWPNDVLCKSRKICGILSEASIESDRIHFVSVGMGLNVNQHISGFPEELREKAGSIIGSTGEYTDRGVLAAKIVSDLSYWINQLETHGPDSVLTSYRQICSTLGNKIQITTGDRMYQGTAVGITSRGEIEVETEGQKLVFSAGDIIHSPHVE
jgi:BirA family biotin operon repressor/biotin-[acetyl-CoA-carboxylase] ligase